MDPTIRSIIDAASLPLSVIIIGVGDADFTKMSKLDGDEGLSDSDGRNAIRDIVQFVPYNKYKSDPIKLAQNVLEELPKQVEEYMRFIGKKPDPPKMADLKKSSERMKNSDDKFDLKKPKQELIPRKPIFTEEKPKYVDSP
jgi:hypothetical protein